MYSIYNFIVLRYFLKARPKYIETFTLLGTCESIYISVQITHSSFFFHSEYKSDLQLRLRAYYFI
jgi:hypothetical protein